MNEKTYNEIKSYLWSRRGYLKCTYCNGAVIFGPYIDSLGFKYNYECVHCNKPQNDRGLAIHNGYEFATVA